MDNRAIGADSPEVIMQKLHGELGDKGFMSCTPVKEGGFMSYCPIHMIMECEAGTPMADLSLWNQNEQEVLLAYGQKFEIKYVEKSVNDEGEVIINIYMRNI